MSQTVDDELLDLTQKLLDCIAQRDWATYQTLCDPSLTAFEPEALGQLVEGLRFHRFYFDLGGGRAAHNTTMCAPRVRVIGQVAIVTYIRLNQRVLEDGLPGTTGSEETRIWQKIGGAWKHIHFHRSPLPKQR